ncbi:MAG: hypothetical protein AAB968_02995, partial [Patescibacteria group bacterium]
MAMNFLFILFVCSTTFYQINSIAQGNNFFAKNLLWSDIPIELNDPTPKILASIRKELKKTDFNGKQELSLQTSDVSHEMYQALLDLTGRKMFHGWVSQIKFKIIGNKFQIELRSEDNKPQDL